MVGEDYDEVQRGFGQFIGDGNITDAEGNEDAECPKLRPEEVAVVSMDDATLAAHGQSRVHRAVPSSFAQTCNENYRRLQAHWAQQGRPMRRVRNFLELGWYSPNERAMYNLHSALVGKSFEWRDVPRGPVTMRVTFLGNRIMVRHGRAALLRAETEWRVASLHGGQIRVAIWRNSHLLTFSSDRRAFQCVQGEAPLNHGQNGQLVS